MATRATATATASTLTTRRTGTVVATLMELLLVMLALLNTTIDEETLRLVVVGSPTFGSSSLRVVTLLQCQY